MKKFTFLLFVLLFGTFVSLGQITAMFVNDESENEQNALLIYETLKNHLPSLAMFDAVDSARSPKTSEMDPYQLVIWYCGSDAMDLYVWNGNGQINMALVNYLDGEGNLWLMGSGFLNDRYGITPQVFSSPLFVYDYLGIRQWYAETYTDDGGKGLPQMDISDDNPLFTLTLEALNWSEAPEPWVDGGLPTSECKAVYEFGPGSYVFSGYVAAYYCTANEMNNLTFTFDPARLESANHINTLFSEVLNFYDEIIAVEEGEPIKENLLTLYPNPATSAVNLQVNLEGKIEIQLYDITGNVIKKTTLFSENGNEVTTEMSIADLPGGLYFLRAESSRNIISRSLVIAR